MKTTRPYHLLIGGLAIILVAQVLNHTQVQASTEKALTQAQVSHKLVAARDLKVSLERGMGFGKPLSLFSGTDKLFENLKTRYEGLDLLAITSPDLKVYASQNAEVLGTLTDQEKPVFPAIDDEKGDAAFRTIVREDLVLVALPLYFNATDLKGIVWLGFSRAPIVAQLEVESRFGLTVLGVGVGLSLVVFAALFFALVGNRMSSAPRPEANRVLYLPLLTRMSLAIVSVLLVAILGYSFATSGRFTSILVKIYEKNVVVLVQSQAEELKRIVNWNLPPEHWKRAETVLAAQIRHTPEAESLTLTNAQGVVLYRADRTSVYPDPNNPEQPVPVYTSTAEGLRVAITDHDGRSPAFLWTKVDQSFIDAILVDRFLDALTVTLVSLIFSIELLLALGLASRVRPKTPLQAPVSEDGVKVIRFTAFLFFMSELLPLPFMPLFISDLFARAPLELLGLSADAIKGLPFSAHLLGVMVFVPIVGALTNRYSLRSLFLLSGALLLVGNVLAAVAPNFELLILFRFLSGLGYGGALAASTGLVIQTTTREKRTSGFAAWGAGFAAASICAVILGGILVSHVGYRNGMLVSALLSLVMAAFGFFFHPSKAPAPEAVDRVRTKFSDLLAPFRDRTTFITLIFASIPVQLAFFGLFQYTLPLVMSQSGITEANIGRILTLYGLISLASPLLARYADRARNEKWLIVAGNAITGVCLSIFFFQSGLWSMVFVVAAIGVGGLLFDTVISSYLSMTKASETYGETKFLSIFLTWEKLFTVFVPILVGTMMSGLGYLPSAAVLGLVILTGAIVFALFGQGKKTSP